jgi:hypothetical protein
MYMRLATLRAKERRTHQEILKQALEEYLDRARALLFDPMQMQTAVPSQHIKATAAHTCSERGF